MGSRSNHASKCDSWSTVTDMLVCIPGDALRLEQLRARRRPRRVPSGPPLALDGWKAMREELVTKERVHLAGGSAVALVAEVEEGDGFRPLSPSQMHE